MKKLLTLLFCAATLSSFAQSATSSKEIYSNTPQVIISPEQGDNDLIAQVVNEFPGGAEAFKTFVLQNVSQPEDIEPGERVTVQVMFVLSADGSIQDVIELQSNGELDQEVISIMNNMQQLELGEQNNRTATVYFTMPVTFVGE